MPCVGCNNILIVKNREIRKLEEQRDEAIRERDEMTEIARKISLYCCACATCPDDVSCIVKMVKDDQVKFKRCDESLIEWAKSKINK